MVVYVYQVQVQNNAGEWVTLQVIGEGDAILALRGHAQDEIRKDAHLLNATVFVERLHKKELAARIVEARVVIERDAATEITGDVATAFAERFGEG